MSCRVLKNKDYQITQHYGNGHTGVDVVGQGGTLDMIVAHSRGKVIFCQKGQRYNPGSQGDASYGNCIKILHDNGMYTLYAHLADVRVNLGQYVEQGQDLGMMGNTGNSTASHLHFEVWNNQNVRINPEPYLNADLDGSVECTGTITYQVYAEGHWLEEVSKCDDTPEGYAGDSVNFISGLRGKPQFGKLYIQAHKMNGDWLEEICSDDYETNDTSNANSYAGIYNEPMDRFRIRSTKGWVDYRVYTARGWLPWVKTYNEYVEGVYAGNDGEPILGIQIV